MTISTNTERLVNIISAPNNRVIPTTSSRTPPMVTWLQAWLAAWLLCSNKISSKSQLRLLLFFGVDLRSSRSEFRRCNGLAVFVMQSTAIVAVLVVGCARGIFGQLTSPPPGSSNFGTWFTDEQKLPAYRYSGHPNASILPKDTAPLEPVIAHQVGNDRVVGVAYTDGSVSVRQVSIAVILCSMRGIRRILLGHLSTVHAQGSSHNCALSIAHFFSLVNHSSTTKHTARF